MLGAVLVAGVLLTAACRGQDTDPPWTSPQPPAAEAPSPTPPRQPTATPPTPEQGAPMDIRITVAGDELRGTLDDTATARDFAALLPLTLTLRRLRRHGEDRRPAPPPRHDRCPARPHRPARGHHLLRPLGKPRPVLRHRTRRGGAHPPRPPRSPGPPRTWHDLTGTVTITLDSPPAPS